MIAWANPPALDKGKCFEIYRILAWGELNYQKVDKGLWLLYHFHKMIKHIFEREFFLSN